MASPLQPEFFSLLSINIFLALGLLTCLFERNFPTAIPYVYQSAALFGFGQLWVSKEFSLIFSDDMRFWCHLAYLSVAVINIIAIDLYLAFLKKQRFLSWIYSGTVVFPSVLVSVFFISVYTNGTKLSLPMLPQIPLEMVYVLLALCGTVLAVGMLTSLKPEMLARLSQLSRLLPNSTIASSTKPSQHRVTKTVKKKRIGNIKKKLSRLIPNLKWPLDLLNSAKKREKRRKDKDGKKKK